MNPLAVMLRPIRGGWAIDLTNGREIARFTGIGARYRAIRYLTTHHLVEAAGRR
jgi:hypothetical protein